jgi:hypothetical protein
MTVLLGGQKRTPDYSDHGAGRSQAVAKQSERASQHGSRSRRRFTRLLPTPALEGGGGRAGSWSGPTSTPDNSFLE